MVKEFEKLLKLKDTEGVLTYSECQILNKYLSKIDINCIPLDQRDNVKEYIVNALNMNSVSGEIVESLEILLANL
jgi:hypothetical protein